MKKTTSTKPHFDLFKKECQKWIAIFGMKGWEIFYTNHPDSQNRATVSWAMLGRTAKINLSSIWEEGATPVTHESVKKAAFHEVCEILLGRMAMMAEGRLSNSRDNVVEETHSIIRTLENILFEKSTINKGVL